VNRLESWLLHLSTAVLAFTGILYAWMHYLMKSDDPFSVVNHPWEPHLLSIHILAAPLLLLAFGIILHSHIVFKIVSGSRIGRKSGWILIPAFAVMIISGYLLQVINSDFRKVLVVVHLVSGVIWGIVYVGHQIASYKMRQNQRSKFRIPVQMLLIGVLCIAISRAEAEPLERQVYSMGTTLRVVMLDDDHTRALRDSEELIKIIEAAEDQLSTWRPKSELSCFNQCQTNRPFQMSTSLLKLMQQLQTWTTFTHGAFDAGIGRLTDVWGIHKTFRNPKQSEISDALSESGLRYVNFDSRNSTAEKLRDIWIDPGGFGKGEALDRAVAYAKLHKLSPFLLDFGGQMAVWGTKDWGTSVANPANRSEVESYQVLFRSGSVSTSGFSERPHHILDPKSGRPVQEFGSVTVWHNQALAADILSTALIVMGPDDGYNWAEKNQIAALFLFNDQREPKMTSKMSEMIKP
jgi:FAD:protein FMN transferase